MFYCVTFLYDEIVKPVDVVLYHCYHVCGQKLYIDDAFNLYTVNKLVLIIVIHESDLDLYIYLLDLKIDLFQA